MAMCKDCIHFDVCRHKEANVTSITKVKDLIADEFKCFKDKSMFIELPCKIGDTAWGFKIIGKFKKAHPGIVDRMHITKNMQVIVNVKYIGCGIWGQKIFPTKEAALASMKEGD